MQELHADRDFLEWLSRVSGQYGNAMAAWSQAVHDAVADHGSDAGGDVLLAATDAAVESLVQLLMAVGARHDHGATPHGGDRVLEALDQLLGASADLLREARVGLADQGIPALAALAPRIGALRALEGDVEAATNRIHDGLADKFGDPGGP